MLRMLHPSKPVSVSERLPGPEKSKRNAPSSWSKAVMGSTIVAKRAKYVVPVILVIFRRHNETGVRCDCYLASILASAGTVPKFCGYLKCDILLFC